jgi:hypothetical protein
MSSGRSSQLVACFSVERTKYLMLSKSMPDRSEPQVGIGFFSKSFEALEPQVEHPLRLAFLAEMSRTTSSLRPRLAVAPAVSGRPSRTRSQPMPSWSTVVMVMSSRRCDRTDVLVPDGGAAGMWSVQTPSPWAIVASRWTCVSSSRPSASVSASHSCGNCSATCCTGQWCWHSWVPTGPSSVEAA